jgi:hypothetical protein
MAVVGSRRALTVVAFMSFVVTGSDGCAAEHAPATSVSAEAGPPIAIEVLPCDVALAVKTACQVCHARPPVNGALMPLITFADTHEPWTQPPTYDKAPTWKVMGDAIEAKWMPQPWPGNQLNDADRGTILAWVRQGAPAAAAGTECP